MAEARVTFRFVSLFFFQFFSSKKQIRKFSQPVESTYICEINSTDDEAEAERNTRGSEDFEGKLFLFLFLVSLEIIFGISRSMGLRAGTEIFIFIFR